MQNGKEHERPDDTSKMDQSAALLGDILPPLWRRIYIGCVDQGFDESESFKLVQTYILGQNPNGTRGTDG